MDQGQALTRGDVFADFDEGFVDNTADGASDRAVGQVQALFVQFRLQFLFTVKIHGDGAVQNVQAFALGLDLGQFGLGRMQIGDGDAVFAFDFLQFGLCLIQLAAGHDARLEQGFGPLVFAFGQFKLRVQGRHGDLSADQACLLGLQLGRGFLVD